MRFLLFKRLFTITRFAWDCVDELSADDSLRNCSERQRFREWEEKREKERESERVTKVERPRKRGWSMIRTFLYWAKKRLPKMKFQKFPHIHRNVDRKGKNCIAFRNSLFALFFPQQKFSLSLSFHCNEIHAVTREKMSINSMANRVGELQNAFAQ